MRGEIRLARRVVPWALIRTSIIISQNNIWIILKCRIWEKAGYIIFTTKSYWKLPSVGKAGRWVSETADPTNIKPRELPVAMNKNQGTPSDNEQKSGNSHWQWTRTCLTNAGVPSIASVVLSKLFFFMFWGPMFWGPVRVYNTYTPNYNDTSNGIIQKFVVSLKIDRHD